MTPRRLAVKALIHQEQAGYANLVLDAELKKCDPPMNTRDAAFAARIFYTTLERLPLLDYTIDRYTKKPVAKLDAPVRAVLRSGLAQAKYMQVPMSAAVNESVRLTKVLGKSSAAGMVNAVLRKAVVTEVHEDDFATPLQRLGTYYCLSPAVAKLLYNQYGEEAFAMAAAFYERPATAIRVNTLRTTDEELTDLLHTEGHSVRPGPWPHALLVEFNGSPAASRAFARGLFHVQGLASQFAALCVGAQPGQKVADLCAAPGGKSLTLAECMQNQGKLISGEYVESRVPLLRKAFLTSARRRATAAMPCIPSLKRLCARRRRTATPPTPLPQAAAPRLRTPKQRTEMPLKPKCAFISSLKSFETTAHRRKCLPRKPTANRRNFEKQRAKKRVLLRN